MPRRSQEEGWFTLRWQAGKVELLDQRKLPGQEHYLSLGEVDEVAEAIETLAVRGAPAIGCAAAMGVALGAWRSSAAETDDLVAELETRDNIITMGFFVNHVARAKKWLAKDDPYLTNVIGGGDWAEDRIVPDCIRALEAGKPIRLRNPDATRPWQHVLDPLNGYLALAAALAEDPEKFGGAWNFGPEVGATEGGG